MQILLEIPDTEIPIERAMDTVTLFFENGHVRKCNYSFKELPKGHGDLIDRGKLKTHFIGTEQGTDLEVYLEPTIIGAKAIVEADTLGEVNDDY